MIKCHLIVGCGGAGLATMTAHLKKLSRCSHNHDFGAFYYLAIDSDERALDEFANNFEHYSHDLDNINGKIINIMRENACDFPSDILRCYFEANANERLKEQWWYDDNGNPYIGQIRTPYSNKNINALECYGLTWRLLPKLDNIIRHFIAWVHSINAVADVRGLIEDVHIISSLAGETGRGIWSLVALKIRECFYQGGIEVKPVGILFDASVYREDMWCNPGKDLRSKVNSLTGLSELSCWDGNEYRQDLILYRLPSLDTPQREDCDVLVGNIEGPIDDNLILKRYDERFPHPQEYYENVGETLFIKMASQAQFRRNNRV